MYKKGGIT